MVSNHGLVVCNNGLMISNHGLMVSNHCMGIYLYSVGETETRNRRELELLNYTHTRAITACMHAIKYKECCGIAVMVCFLCLVRNVGAYSYTTL